MAENKRPVRAAATGWFNWYVDRGRMSTTTIRSDARRASWRRAL